MANDESKIIKTEFIEQYEHTWRVFEGIVNDFDNDAWIHTGRGTITPVRLAFHILQAVKYYIEDSTTIVFASGKSFESNWETVKEESLPSQDDILICIGELKAKTVKSRTSCKKCGMSQAAIRPALKSTVSSLASAS